MSVDDVSGDPSLIVTGGFRSVGNYAVIGHPIAHSKSPTLHNAWFKDKGLGFDYVALDIPPGELVLRAPALPFEYAGVNVTIPHKRAVLGYVDAVDPNAEAAGAANILYRDRDSKAWTAGNTDGDGFVMAFEEALGEPVSGRDVLVLGAGGASRAICAALVKHRVSSLTIGNRTLDTAVELGRHVGAHAAMSLGPTMIEACDRVPDLVVNTLPAAAEPFFHELDLHPLPDHAVVADINYHVGHPTLLTYAEDRGLWTLDGRGMFLWQAALSFEQWLGERPDLDVGRRILGMDGAAPDTEQERQTLVPGEFA